MSTERPAGETCEGELYIRDLSRASGEKGGGDKREDDGEEGIVTTMMLGEEGDRYGRE